MARRRRPHREFAPRRGARLYFLVARGFFAAGALGAGFFATGFLVTGFFATGFFAAGFLPAGFFWPSFAGLPPPSGGLRNLKRTAAGMSLLATSAKPAEGLADATAATRICIAVSESLRTGKLVEL